MRTIKMKKNNPSDDDKALHDLLKEWKVESSLPPRFQERVWRRIETEEAQPVPAFAPWAAIRKWIADYLPRPSLAIAYVAVLLAAGAGVGWTRAQHETQRVNTQLSQQYVHALDPFLAAN